MSHRLSLLLTCLLVARIGLAAEPPHKPVERRDEPQEANDFFVLKRAPRGETAIPAERYFKALERMRVMPQHSLQAGVFLPSRAELAERGISYVADAQTLGAWSSIGPGNVGGRTRALVVDPRDPRILFAGGVAGGVWKTTNGGGSWRPLNDLMANLAIGSLAMDPTDSSTLYAGTGEGYFNADSIRGAGIFKTTDGGLNWTRLGATANTPDFHYVNDLVVSPRDPRRVYAATRTGVWRSLDAGESWTRVVDPRVRGGCLDLALRTDTGGDALFASCGTFEGNAGIWRNQAAERGGGWSRVLSRKGMGRTSIAIAPSNQNVVYALAASNLPGPGGRFRNGLLALYRSQDGGRTWSVRLRNTNKSKLDTLLLSNPVYGYASFCFGTEDRYYNQGWYDNVIAVDPVNPNRVWAGGVDLFRSDDGGKSWALMSYWWAPTGERSYVHADQHVIVFHPDYDGRTNRTMFVGNDGGVFRTGNALTAGVTSAALHQVCAPLGTGLGLDWADLNNGYGVTQFYSGAVYPDGATYLGGTQDNGTVRGGQGSGDWREILGGDGGYVAVNPDDTRVLYASYTGLSLAKSLDGGNRFREAVTGIANTGFLFIAPFVMDPSEPDRLWTGGGHLWRTDNAAAGWTQASVLLSDRASVSALAVAPSNPNRVLAGRSDGVIHAGSQALSANAGTGWGGAKPRDGFVSSVAFDPRNADIAYATYSTFGGTHVWKSTDGGATWSGLDGSGAGALPDLPAHSIVVDPDDGRRLYLGTDLGVFVSTDGGASWAVENTGFANVITEALVLSRGSGGSRTLFAFTHGRGAWRVSIGN